VVKEIMLCNNEHFNFLEHNKTVFKIQCESASSAYQSNLVTSLIREDEGGIAFDGKKNAAF
jgi:hypothetical protein